MPKWPRPLPQETLDGYSQRLTITLNHHVAPILGGASFGGIVALHVAKYLQPAAVILVGSLRSSYEIPRWIRAARSMRFLVPLMPVSLLQKMAWTFTTKWMRTRMPHFSGLARQFANSDPLVFKWGLLQLLRWDSTVKLNCPVYQIHGAYDRVLPLRYVSPNRVVSGGHVISLSNSDEVNEFIDEVTAQFSVDLDPVCPDGNEQTERAEN